MASGPDEETWAKMSPLAKRIYWIVAALFVALMAASFIVPMFWKD